MTDTQKILELALEIGFSVSTAYGQESPKLMPISDADTLIRFYQAAQDEALERAAARAKVVELLNYNSDIRTYPVYDAIRSMKSKADK